jgi:hypothetical protein
MEGLLPRIGAHSKRPFHRVVLKRHIQSGKPCTPILNCDVHLLPGGQYILFRHKALLECWSLVEEKVIWRYQEEANDALAWVKFAPGMVQGHNVTIAVLTLRPGLNVVCVVL